MSIKSNGFLSTGAKNLSRLDYLTPYTFLSELGDWLSLNGMASVEVPSIWFKIYRSSWIETGGLLLWIMASYFLRGSGDFSLPYNLLTLSFIFLYFSSFENSELVAFLGNFPSEWHFDKYSFSFWAFRFLSESDWIDCNCLSVITPSLFTERYFLGETCLRTGVWYFSCSWRRPKSSPLFTLLGEFDLLIAGLKVHSYFSLSYFLCSWVMAAISLFSDRSYNYSYLDFLEYDELYSPR